MANRTSPPPPPHHHHHHLLLLLFFFFLTTATAIDDTTNQELEITLHALRNHGGFMLFTNAITTSDLQFQLTNITEFTIFAPKDAPLFTLDMESDAVSYVGTLRYHVIPNRRLAFSDLQNLTSPFLDTLLPHYSVLIGKTMDNDAFLFNGSTTTTGVMVDGVRVSDPDLFLGPRFAVHGINGVLETGLNIRHQDFGGSGRISPAEAPAPLSGFDWNIPAAAPGSESHGSIPVAAPGSESHGNIPIPPISEFEWSTVPVAAPDSGPRGNIPVEGPSGKFPGRVSRVKRLGRKKKHGKHHIRHRGRHDHRLNDL